VAVEGVCDTGREEVVYNCRVAQYHTYFVGDAAWGFSVWAHNRYDITQEIDLIGRPGKQNHVRVVSSQKELEDIFLKYTEGGKVVPLTKAHIDDDIVMIVDVEGTAKGVIRIIYRKNSTSGGPAVDIMTVNKNKKGRFNLFGKIHIDPPS